MSIASSSLASTYAIAPPLARRFTSRRFCLLFSPSGSNRRREPPRHRGFFWFLTIVSAIAAIGAFIPAWFRRLTTEIAVTDRRIILKRGFIRRSTIEMNMQKVESIDVDQTLAGRLFNYGNVTIRGTGSSFATLRLINSPLKLRTSVTAA